MLKEYQIVYCPPPFEEVQNEPTLLNEDGSVVLESSFHSDISLMLRIDALDKLSAHQYSTLKEQMQPLIDSSNFRTEFEESFGKLTDDELLQSCPSRYLQTQSEQKCYLENLAAKDKECRLKAAEESKKRAEKEKLEQEASAFNDAIRKIFER